MNDNNPIDTKEWESSYMEYKKLYHTYRDFVIFFMNLKRKESREALDLFKSNIKQQGLSYFYDNLHDLEVDFADVDDGHYEFNKRTYECP